jgi:effector-binding domain-containing protein
VGMDYERGLALLKDVSEDGEVHSKLEFRGEQSFDGCQYIAIETVCNMSQIGSKMEEDFTKLYEYAGDHPELMPQKPISVYHKWQVVKQKVQYTAALPVSNLPSALPKWLKTGSIPATRIYVLRHIGPYHHIGNAWSTLSNMQRGKEFKVNKKIHPFEWYINTPDEVSENELITDVCFPLK